MHISRLSPFNQQAYIAFFINLDSLHFSLFREKISYNDNDYLTK